MILCAQSLAKRYGAAPAFEAVREASLDLQAGTFVSIVGRSGSGKSTLMAMLGALTRPTQGKVLLDGADVWMLAESELADFRCRQIGFIFQFASLLPSLSAVDNVALPALLGRTVDAQAAYGRAYHLLAQVGLAERVDAYPAAMSGGEQRRVAVARALINSPRLLLADEPTSDLDEDTEAEIIDLIEHLQRTHAFGLALVTHNLEIANRAQRRYEMRQGVLMPVELPEPANAPLHGRRYCGSAKVALDPEPTEPSAARTSIRLGRDLRQQMQTFMLVGVTILAGILLLNSGIGRYQGMQVRERSAQIARLRHMALNGLRGDVQSIADLGAGRYDVTTYLQNVGEGTPIDVLSPELHAYVQVGSSWQEVPIDPAGEGPPGVQRIEGKRMYRHVLEARIASFAQLLPYYMHVRFSATMLVTAGRIRDGEIFERKDNYYVYLKPFDVADEVVLKRMPFSGKPPVWIPMPPH